MIKNLHHTSLKSSPFFEISRVQFHYFGSILTFELESKEATYRFMDKLKIIKIASNIHDNKSLIISPYDVIYAGSSKREELGISSTMLRLSVGIEDVADLKDDITGGIRRKYRYTLTSILLSIKVRDIRPKSQSKC